MAEYIERESLINHVEDLPTWGADGNLLDREDVIGSIENRLAADVVPVRHGRWILDEKRYVIYCSECSAPVSYYPNIKDVREENHYCPNCGCKMDLEEAKNAKQT